MVILATDSSEMALHQGKVTELLRLSQRISQQMKKLKTASEAFNLNDYRNLSRNVASDIEALSRLWQEFGEANHTFSTQTQALLHSPDYPLNLAAALQAENIPLAGNFPQYDIPPFKLWIKLEQPLAQLSMGRKSQQTYSLSPKALAAWVAKNYRAVVERTFDHRRFCKELLSVYPYLSHRNWGVPVPIKEVYALLTLRTEARQKYPESHFIFDLSRLLERYDIQYDQYSFAFSPHKQTHKNYIVANQQGKTRAIGHLTIFESELASAESPPPGFTALPQSNP